MANPRFVDIDPAAKDGGMQLLRDVQGHQHCARWNAVRQWFEYGNGEAVGRTITAYASRDWK